MVSEAQGTIEYLVVIGVVVVISLVVVGLMASLTDNQSVAKASKKIGAYSSTISVTDAAMDSSGDAIFVVRSNQGNDLTLSSIVVNGSQVLDSSQVNQSSPSKIEISGIEDSCCEIGEVGQKDCEVTFNYNTPYLGEGTSTLIVPVECMENVVVSEEIVPENLGDTTPPTVTLNSPAHNSMTSANSMIFNLTATDNSAVSSCTLKINGIDVNSNATHIGNDWSFTQNISSYSNGNYDWNVSCVDTNNNRATSGLTYTLIIYRAIPVVYLSYPQNGTEITTPDFNFWVSDVGTVNSCDLVIGETVYATITNPQKDSNLTLSLTSAPPSGLSNWDVNCVNSTGVQGISEVRSLTNNYFYNLSSFGTISSTGYYFLTTNLNSTGQNISVQADNVTIEGNNKTITGNGTATGIDASVVSNHAKTGLFVKNLTITGFGVDIQAVGANDPNWPPTWNGGTGGNGGSITLSNVTAGDINSNGGNGAYYGDCGIGGNIIITNSTLGRVYSASGTCGWHSSHAGNISISSSTASIVSSVAYASGFDNERAGDINVISSTIGTVDSRGFGSTNTGGYSGNVLITDSNIINVLSYGGGGNVGGIAGTVNATNSRISLIDANGGRANWGAAATGGTVTLTNSTIGIVNSRAGDGYICASTWGGGTGGSVIIKHSSFISPAIVVIRGGDACSGVAGPGGTYTHCLNSPEASFVDRNGGTGGGGNGAAGTSIEICP